MRYIIIPTHISRIRPGDTIEVEGNLHTVCHNDLKSGFMGLTLRGDSYRCGTVPVARALITQAKPNTQGLRAHQGDRHDKQNRDA